MERSGPGQMRIGDSLAAARARAGLDLSEVERRTKIRGRYLRALEDERWEDLPSHAYAKGYLRSYAELLGLDADTLVDEYRRQVEGAAGAEPASRTEWVPEGGKRRPVAGPSGPGPRTGVLVALGAVLAIATLALIGLLGEDEDPERPDRRAAQRPERERRSAAEAVTLRIVILEAVEVCLLGEDRRELIDGQVLAPGSRDEYRAKRFQLRFPAGFKPDQLRVSLDGKRRRLPKVGGPAAFRITGPARIREAPPPGESCP